jgi:hypothetical protein
MQMRPRTKKMWAKILKDLCVLEHDTQTETQT